MIIMLAMKMIMIIIMIIIIIMQVTFSLTLGLPLLGLTLEVTTDFGNLSLQSANYKGKDKLVVGNGSKFAILHIGNAVYASNLLNILSFLIISYMFQISLKILNSIS